MKTTKELIERIQDDAAFADEIRAKVADKRDAGAKDHVEAFKEAVAELGYEATDEDIEAYRTSRGVELEDDVLTMVAGGGCAKPSLWHTSCLCM